jgi:ABC-type bacteriocin/lantibiotic exporter with double-glycine peptidase domain
MAIDTQRIMDLTSSINTLWTSPLTIILSLYFLWGYLGPSSLAGLVVMVLLIPVNAVLSSKMKTFQFANMKNKDKRIKVMNEILDGMKVLKLYAWEPSFEAKVQEIRDEEVTTLKKMSYIGAVQTFLFTAAPFIVAISSFATFVLVDPKNVLDAEIAFVSLSFFNLMRQPLNQVHLSIVYLWFSISEF